MAAGRGEDPDVEAFKAGDREVVSRVERAAAASVRSFRLGDPDLERELVQETLSRALASLAENRFQRQASLETYARRIARYVCLEHLRRRRREVSLDAEQLLAGQRWSAPEDSYLSNEEHEKNLRAFAALPEACREILRLISLEGLTYREVAGRLGISEASLKSRVHRCRLLGRDRAKALKLLSIGKVAP